MVLWGPVLRTGQGPPRSTDLLLGRASTKAHGVLTRVGTALADPTRRRVLVELLNGPGYPSELAELLGASRANLSNHLTCLRQCGLVTATAQGRRIRYELADPRLGDALQLLASLDLPGFCDR